MTPLSVTRLWILRGLYFLIALGTALTIWPSVFAHSAVTPDAHTVVSSMLTGMSFLCLVGLRYPVQMLPVLMFELLWKLTWMLAYGLPAVRSGHVDTYTQDALFSIGMGIVLTPIAIPWTWLPNFLRTKSN